MTTAFIHVVMRINRLEEPGETPAEPVEAHFIQMVADSRAGVLAKMPSNRAYVFYVKMVTLYGEKTVAEFPGVNTRIQVEEPRETPRSRRRLPRETVDPNLSYCNTCHSPLNTMKGDHCPFCGTPQPHSKQNRS